jgi:methyl-accepting chemotaxis protein
MSDKKKVYTWKIDLIGGTVISLKKRIRHNCIRMRKYEEDVILLRNMKIGKKLMIAFLSVVIISSIGGIVGFAEMATMNSQYSSALVDYGFAQGDIEHFSATFNNNTALIRDVIIQTDQANMKESRDQLDRSNTQLQEEYNKLKSAMKTEKDKSNYKTIGTALDLYSLYREQVVNFATGDQKEEAYNYLEEKCLPRSTVVQGAINDLIKEKTDAGNQMSADLNNGGKVSEAAIGVAILLSIFFSAFIGVVISRSISRPVNQLVLAAEKMAEGDLSTEMSADTTDEIGKLAAAFQKTGTSLRAYINDISANLAKVEKGDLTIHTDLEYKGDFISLRNSIAGIVSSMNAMITQIRQAADNVSTGSRQVSDASQGLAQGAAEQASSVEELSATMMEISAQVGENAQHVRRASENVDTVTTEIDGCNGQMQQMVHAMEQISNSSNQIAKIIKTIEDIAFQTNILALNAAVEAARAGEAGKGFAVVADEVRNLASKSAAAAKDTTKLIQDSVNQVEKGTKITGSTAEALLRVVDSAKAVSETVENISQATAKQSNAIRQVNAGVEQISNVVQTNSATAEESAAASEELSGQARLLSDLVKTFQLKEERAAEPEQTQSSDSDADEAPEVPEVPEAMPVNA